MADINTTPLTVTPDSLATSAARYRRELLQVPFLQLGHALAYFTLRTGIRHSETVGELSGGLELGPHDPHRVDKTAIEIAGRTLRTYFGSVKKEFDPNKVVQSVYGSSITKGEGLKNVPIALQVLSYMAALVGDGLRKHLFDAKRDDSGTRTVDLFDGIDTITAAEVTAGNLSASKGNLYEFTEAITKANAVDQLVAFCRAASDELLGNEDGMDAQGGGLNLIVPREIVYAYRDDYKTTTGTSPVYDKFNQTVIEGFPNIKLVPFTGKAGSPFIQLTTKSNLLIGTDQTGDLENMIVEKHDAFLIQFAASLFFGTDYESLSPERLLVGKLAGA